MECERAVAANDGRSLIARSARTGLFLLEPATGTQKLLDDSSAARQNAELAASEDGALLAEIVDHNSVQLLRLPAATLFADLRSRRSSPIRLLRWDTSGSRLASCTVDGWVQVWNLQPWRQWLAAHRLDSFP